MSGGAVTGHRGSGGAVRALGTGGGAVPAGAAGCRAARSRRCGVRRGAEPARGTARRRARGTAVPAPPVRPRRGAGGGERASRDGLGDPAVPAACRFPSPSPGSSGGSDITTIPASGRKTAGPSSTGSSSEVGDASDHEVADAGCTSTLTAAMAVKSTPDTARLAPRLAGKPRTDSAAHRAAGRRDRDQHREGDREPVVVNRSVKAERRHAQVVHGGHAETGDDTRGRERGGRRAQAADREDADADHQDRHRQTEQGQGRVVVDRGLLDVEADHGDEVHRPDAAADRGRPGASRPGFHGCPPSWSERTVQRSPSAPPRQAVRQAATGVTAPWWNPLVVPCIEATPPRVASVVGEGTTLRRCAPRHSPGRRAPSCTTGRGPGFRGRRS